MTDDDERFPSTSSDLTELIHEALNRRPPLRHRVRDWWRGLLRKT